MEDVTRDLFVSLAAFAGIFGIAYVFMMTRHKEHMSMLEKGVDPSVFASKGKTKSTTLKIGMLCVGVALGLFLGDLLAKSYLLEAEVAYLCMIFLFGGLSLILNFVIDRKMQQ